MTTGVKWNRNPFKSKAAGKVMNDEIREEMRFIGNQIAAFHLIPLVQYWSDPVEFKVVSQATANRVLMSITPTGSDDAVRNWNMVDRGRNKDVTIEPKRKEYLRFKTGYVRKTSLGASLATARPGSRSGNWVTTKAVKQGHVEAGNYIEKAQKELEPLMKRRVRSAYRRAYRKVTGKSI